MTIVLRTVGKVSHGGGKMNKRRELTRQRLSRIGGLAAVDNAVGVRESEVMKGKPVGAPSIEAVLGAYMPGKRGAYDLRTRQDNYVSTSTDPKQQLSRQMSEYMTMLEGSAGGHFYKSAKEDGNESEARTEAALRQDASARYKLEHYAKNQDEAQSVYDILDENRCSGFLLYSYNKNGVHSVLGEDISSAGCGGRITGGSFISKA